MKKFWLMMLVIAVIALIILIWGFYINAWIKPAVINDNFTATTIPTITSSLITGISLSTDNTAVNCAVAKAFFENGDYDLANNAYQAILGEEPKSKCALEGITLLSLLPLNYLTQTPVPTTAPTATPNAATVVPALVALGDIDGAWEAAKTSVKTDPDMIKSVPLWYRIWMHINHFIIKILIPVIAFLLAAWILWIIVSRLIRGRFHYQLDMTDFSSGTYTDDEKNIPSLGKSITSRAELILNRHFNSIENDNKIQICNPINPPQLPAFAPTQISTLLKFFTELFPATIIEVNGLLEKNAQEGLGLSLKMIQKDTQNYLDQTIIWENEINPPVKTEETNNKPETFFLLVEVAAAWIFWTYCLHQKFKPRKIFGTEIFDSYKWQFLSTKRGITDDEAEKYLLNAMKCDKGNLVALTNLGGLYYKKFMQIESVPNGKKKKAKNKNLENKEKMVHDDQIKRIDQITQKLFKVIQLSDPDDLPAVYANYNLGCLKMDVENFNKSIMAENVNQEHQKELLYNEKLEKTKPIKFFEKAYFGAKNTKSNMSQKLRFTMQLPYIEMQMQQNETEVIGELLNIEKFKDKDGNLAFNLACLFSRLSVPEQQIPEVIHRLTKIDVDKLKDMEVVEAFQDKAEEYLDLAFRLDANMATLLKNSIVDPCFNNVNLEMYKKLIDQYSD